MPRKKSSVVWNVFEKCSNDSNFAVCTICKKEYTSSGNTSNLMDHIRRMHPKELSSSDVDTLDELGEPVNKKTKVKQICLSQNTFLYGKGSAKRRLLDRKVAMMIAIDMQPFSFVEDQGFLDLMKTVDPAYKVPTHFIYQKQLRSAVLKTDELPGSHTAVHIKDYIQTTLQEFETGSHKIICITADNASNVKAACNLLNMTYLPCFAHTSNLCVTDSVSKVKEFNALLVKCKDIINFFKRSNVAMDVLRKEQDNAGKPRLKLLRNCETRWNSILIMFERILQVGDTLLLAQCKVKNSPPALTADDITSIQDLIKILKPLNDATAKLSGELYCTATLIVPMVVGLHMTIEQQEVKTTIAMDLKNSILNSIAARLFQYEQRITLQIATLMDPRFKSSFRSLENSLNGKTNLQKEVASFLRKNDDTPPEAEDEPIPTPSHESDDCSSDSCEDSLLSFINQRNMDSAKNKHATSNSIIIVRQYLESTPADLKSEPIDYWLDMKMKDVTWFPLYQVAQKFLCVPATSVPSERIFSKAGNILCVKRSKLKPKNVNIIIFISKNKWIIS